MRLLKSHPILGLANSYMIDSPQPASLSYMWNFGSLLGVCLVIQIITGITLAMHYTPNIDLAFISVEHIMRDVHYGWLIRYLHANVASFFFIFVYLHIGRGLYYGSYRSPRVLLWSIGVIILVLMMATAFLGKLLAQNDDMFLHTLSIDTISICSVTPILYSERLKAYLSKRSEITPIFTWEGLHLPNIKEIVYPTLKQVAGIYLIVNLVTGQSYIGSAVLGRMHIRFHKHLFGGTGNKPLWNAVQKYGLENFAFLVIDEIPDFTSNMNQQLLDLETAYIAAYGDYNIAREAGNTLGVTHTEAQREAMRANYSQARRDAIGALNRGKKLRPETVELMRAAALSRQPMSDESRAKVSANSAKALLLELSMVDGSALPDGTTSIVLRTVPVVAEYCNCNEKTVRRALKGNGIIKGKWLVKSLGLAMNMTS
ncbi:hypothetical protein B8W95_11575 [Staphylococcus pasteuri]|jgi:group I intron endonuclease|nr:hypothetical protein B8W95_11575 [Staphylococcus pasteuri]